MLSSTFSFRESRGKKHDDVGEGRTHTESEKQLSIRAVLSVRSEKLIRLVRATVYGFTYFKRVVSPIYLHTSLYDGMGIHAACHPMDAPFYRAFIPDASDLPPGLLQFLGYCVMVEGQLIGYALRNLYADKVAHSSLKTMQKAAINEARLTLAYWLIILPDMRYNLKNSFSRDATTIR